MQFRDIWSRVQNVRSPELPAGPATARKRRIAEQGIAGQWGQLARCTVPGSRTVVHRSTWASNDTTSGVTVVHLHGPPVTLVVWQWCICTGLQCTSGVTVVHLHRCDSGASARASSDTSGVTVVHLHGPLVTLVVWQWCMSVSGTVHDGVLAQSGLRDSALHELYGCIHFTVRPTC